MADENRAEFDEWWRTTTYGASRQHVAWEAWKAATNASLGWRKLAESLLALAETDKRIKEISARYGLDEGRQP